MACGSLVHEAAVVRPELAGVGALGGLPRSHPVGKLYLGEKGRHSSSKGSAGFLAFRSKHFEYLDALNPLMEGFGSGSDLFKITGSYPTLQND